jgi:uncharacterized membrane protein
VHRPSYFLTSLLFFAVGLYVSYYYSSYKYGNELKYLDSSYRSIFNIMNMRLTLILLVYTPKMNSSKMCLKVKHMVMRLTYRPGTFPN